MPRVLHFSAFLSHNLPLCSFTNSLKTIALFITVINAMHLLQLYSHCITVRVFSIHSREMGNCSMSRGHDNLRQTPCLKSRSFCQAKLAAAIRLAKRDKRSSTIAWLDITNAYGSVHHSLIQFCLSHYHAPPEFCALIQLLYTGLSATVSTDEWCTTPILLGIGVYQGDPLSVAIFLTAMNTLSDTLSTRSDLGFSLSSSLITSSLSKAPVLPHFSTESLSSGPCHAV